MTQFIAGSILDEIDLIFEKNSQKSENFKSLLNWCSYFNIIGIKEYENDSDDQNPLISVLINAIQRGLPTNLNKYALDFIIEKSSLIEFDSTNQTAVKLNYSKIDESVKNLFFRSLHLVDPRIIADDLRGLNNLNGINFDSEYEEKFFFNYLPRANNSINYGLLQLICPQREILTLVPENKDLDQTFDGQRMDFSIEFPYIKPTLKKGVVVEIDGSQHSFDRQQRINDRQRDTLINECGWYQTIRIKTEEFRTNSILSNLNNNFSRIIDNDYVNHCLHNYKNPIWESPKGLEVLQLSLIPFAISRVQRTILFALSRGILELDKPIWRIGVIERDVPCGQLAINDLTKLIFELNSISIEKLSIPKIELQIFSSKEFIGSNFREDSPELISKFNPNEFYDLVIDVSMLMRSTISNPINSNASEYLTLRSLHYFKDNRSVLTGNLIQYKNICELQGERSEKTLLLREKEGLEYLLQSWFRKKSFREGQLPILNNSLQIKSVIGLLPTGGGKSLTYQLSALLQPGICLVIDPIISLMKDQVEGLKKFKIDNCLFINSSLKGKEKALALNKLKSGGAQFVFISPERLQMQDFRDLLAQMNEEEIYFSYCVIDEAHCVSEWGHDFRTAYLKLGENAVKYCKTKNAKNIPLFGLTATASYDVLADVQRELSGKRESTRLTEEAIVRSEYSKRLELQYSIIEVDYESSRIASYWDLRKELGKEKQLKTIELIANLPNELKTLCQNRISIFSDSDWENNKNNEQDFFANLNQNDFKSDGFFQNFRNGILVFCPHTRGFYGVTDKFKDGGELHGYYDYLNSIPDLNAGFFMGSNSSSNIANNDIQLESFENQDKFINNEINLMVATKAFGMGIDKENIRSTIHVTYPGSIESFVQESGRAGRDRNLAISYILFNDQEVYLPNEIEPFDHDLDVNFYFHNSSFKGILKEWTVVTELLETVYFPDKTKILENEIYTNLNIEINCNLWERGQLQRLYINFSYHEPLGYLNLSNLEPNFAGSVDLETSKQVINHITSYINKQNFDYPIIEWVKESQESKGIENILKSKRIGEEFELTVGFNNNHSERIELITKWLQHVIDRRFDKNTVNKMRSNCNDSDDFIEEICEKYLNLTGKELDFKKVCESRDRIKNNPQGTAFKQFGILFNGYRNKSDTEKAIYRLSTIGIIDDYTVNFKTNTFVLFGKKKPYDNYRMNLRDYLLKYYSQKSTESKLRKLRDVNESSTLRKSIYFLIDFVYNEIQKKRELAIHDMRTACRVGLEKGNVEFKEYIDLYFNSKYARNGYSFDRLGEEINASIADETKGGKEEDIEWVWKYINIIEEDPTGSEIDNIKHLRGACIRMLSTQPDNYVLLLLNAYTLYRLEYKNLRYLVEAENLLTSGFMNIHEKETNWSEEKLKESFDFFVLTLKDKNEELENYMNKYGLSFDFESIMIHKLLEPLRETRILLENYNKILL